MILDIPSRLSDEQGKEAYSIDEYIGSGGFGEVYRATDLRDQSVKAIKVLKPELVESSPEFVQFFTREAEAATQIEHENVVKVYGAHQAPLDDMQIHYIVMEYIERGDLHAVLRGLRAAEQYLDLDKLLDWMHQLLSGLAAFSSKLVHRDLKPENVLVKDSILKISDFGMAKFVEQATRTETLKGAGTPQYMAPEAWELKNVDWTADQYSMGVIFYELATLTLPFEAHSWPELRQCHLFQVPPRPKTKNPNLPMPLDGMIMKMLEKEPSQRYASGQSLIDQLARVRQEAPSAPEPPPLLADIASRARQTYEKRTLATAKRRQEEAQKKELQELILFQAGQLLDKLDETVNELNTRLPEAPISIRRGSSPMSGRVYRFYNNQLVVELCPLHEIPPELASHGVICAGWLSVMRGRDHTIGKNIALRRPPDAMYGEWITCEIKDSAGVPPKHPHQPYALHLSELTDALTHHWQRIMHIYEVKIWPFKIEDFTNLLEELVG